MWRRNRDLVVPIRDRRQRKRILTLKNFRNALIVVLVLFTVLTIRSEMRGRKADDYGRLVGHELPVERPVGKPTEIVTEQPAVRDETSADPMLVGPAARAQYLGVTTLEPLPSIATGTDSQRRGDGKGRVVIVGGVEGVTITRDNRPRPPKLGGGFGRP